MQASELDTKTVILDAAEHAFADLGFDGASLRHIITMAGVNLAAVHYHFGSKDALIAAVFSRRIGPLNEERLKLLEQAEKRSGGKPPIEQIIEALIGPALKLSHDPEKGGRVFMRLMGRMVAEPTEGLQKLFIEQFRGIAERFIAALGNALPNLPRAELLWRFHFMIGTMGHMMCDPQNIKEFSGGLCDPSDRDAVTRRMVNFLAAGMRARV